MEGLSRRGGGPGHGRLPGGSGRFPGPGGTGRDGMSSKLGTASQKTRAESKIFFADPGTRGRRVLTRNDRQGDTADASRWTAESAMGGVVSSGWGEHPVGMLRRWPAAAVSSGRAARSSRHGASRGLHGAPCPLCTFLWQGRDGDG